NDVGGEGHLSGAAVASVDGGVDPKRSCASRGYVETRTARVRLCLEKDRSVFPESGEKTSRKWPTARRADRHGSSPVQTIGGWPTRHGIPVWEGRRLCAAGQ